MGRGLRFWVFLVPGFIVAMVSLRGWSSAADLFVRGDVDQSSRLDVSDAVAVLRFLFAGERQLVTCDDAADADDSGVLDASDPVYLLGALFRGGPVPAAPFPACGEDPTEDALGCEAYEVCRFAFTFYGVDFAADGGFFVVDRSGSMRPSGELQRAGREILRFIAEAPSDTRFGLVFFDAGILKFPSNGIAAQATQEMKDSALAFVNSAVSGGAGSCIRSGLLSALEFARSSGARRNAIILVSDGTGICEGVDGSAYLEETVEVITRENAGMARISTIGVLEPTWGTPFLKELSSRNGGTFTQIR